MLTAFNRAERISVMSMEKLPRIRNALTEAGIASQVRAPAAAAVAIGRSRGMPTAAKDYAYQYAIYVHKNDLHRG